MKPKNLLIFLLFIFTVTITTGQTFISSKQDIITYDNHIKRVLGERKVIINGNKFEADIPDTAKMVGTLKFYKDIVEKGKKVKGYKIDGGGIIWVSFDNVFINLYARPTRKSYSYYFSNYIEPTKAEQIAEQKKSDKELEEYMYKSHIKMFNVFTANCIRDKKIRPNMQELAIALIMDEHPDAINKTELVNMIKKQYVFGNTYIYTENGIVTAIQTRQ